MLRLKTLNLKSFPFCLKPYLLWMLMLLLSPVLSENSFANTKVQDNKTLPVTTPIYAGERVTIYSKILSEQRSLLIKLPESYGKKPLQRYPVLVTLDGDTHFRHITGTVDWLSNSTIRVPELIVVAITNTNRGRDMSANFNNGGANEFIAFISDEVLPFIDNTYRTQPFRILAGHSMAGHLTLNAFVQKPQLFNAYISMTPFFGQDRGETQLTDLLLEQLKKEQVQGRFIYATIGDEPAAMAKYELFANALESANAPDNTKNLYWHSEKLLSDSHMSVPTNTMNNALQFIFKQTRLEPTSNIAR